VANLLDDGVGRHLRISAQWETIGFDINYKLDPETRRKAFPAGVLYSVTQRDIIGDHLAINFINTLRACLWEPFGVFKTDEVVD
jgi:hypothetical protein